MVKILLEGRPGVGKTTLAIAVVDALADRGVEASGFTTKELREQGRRVGFLIEAIGGRSEVMAHVDYSGPPRVGKYGSISRPSSTSPCRLSTRAPRCL